MPDQRKSERAEPRAQCYDEIRRCMEAKMREYYKEHPERLMDERSVQEIEMMRSVLGCMLAVLDGYEIQTSGHKGAVK